MTDIIKDRLLESSKRRGGTAKELSERAFCGYRTAFTKLNQLHAAGEIRIVGWRRGKSGPIHPVYGKGPGIDIEKPAPLEATDICKRYRARQREKFGEHYGRIHEAQKQHIPGRSVVVDGKVIYQQ
jgi:hypothetical protein